MSSFAVGQIIEARCSRCNDITGHVVAVCMGGIPVKVECRACGSVHRYVAPDTPARVSKTSTVRVRAGKDRAEAVGNAVHAEAVRQKREEDWHAGSKVKRGEKRAAQKQGETEKRWQDALAKILTSPVPYAMTGAFPVDSLIEHPVFGVGAVLELFPPDKMDVLFCEGVKRLRCAC